MITTPFTDLVGCTVPVQLAGMGGMSTTPLIAAVSNAGGLGMLGGAQIPAEALVTILADIRSNTPNGKFGVNFLMPFLGLDCVERAAQKADVVEFFYDTPDADLVRRVHDHGAIAGWQIGSKEEAQKALDAGCDYLIAQGVEAGGHVRGTAPLLVLLDQVTALASAPVLAAGGVATGQGLAASLAAGAAGVRIGTRFLTAAESVAHPRYIEALLAAEANDTVLTTAFSDGWPNAPHRVLRSCIDAAEKETNASVGSISLGSRSVPLPRFNIVPPDSSATGNIDAMCLYAGQSVETVARREPAADIVDDIIRGAETALTKAAGQVSRQ